MTRPSHIIPARVTGQTPLYCSQMQDWAVQHWDEQGIECYCLDAPDYVPTGRTFATCTRAYARYAQTDTVSRNT